MVDGNASISEAAIDRVGDNTVQFAHVDEVADVDLGPFSDKPHRRVIGQVETSFRGVDYTGGVQPYTVFLWQRLIDAGRHPAATALFAAHELTPLVEVDLPIRVARRDNIEVWA